jgi:hypothetical protein
MKRNTLHALLVGLLATLTFAACGESEDPADGGNNGGNNGANNGSNNGGNNGTNNGNNGTNNGNNGNNGTNNGNNGTNNGNNGTNNGNNGTNNGNNGNNNGANNGGECNEDLTYSGQVFAEQGNPLSPNGGVPTTSAYSGSYDAGIEAAVAALPEAGEDDDNTPDADNEATVDIEINGATVVASYFNSEGQPVPRANRQFWIQDGKAAIQIFFPAGEEGDEIRMMHPDFNIKVGQKISFRATKVTNFNGVGEITGVEPGSWALESEDNEVFIDNRTGDSITLEDTNRLIRVTGTLTGPGTACGSDYLCFDLDHGAANTIALRTNSQFVMSGDCVTFVGPVGAFGGAPQLNVANFDWLRSPFRE